MKKFLLAATAVALCATAASAINDDHHETRIRAAVGSHVMMAEGGTVIEIRGEDGERTVHITRDEGESTLRVNGQVVEVRGDTVIVDGQEIEAGDGSVVIIEGDEVRVVDSEFGADFGPGFAMHWAERAEDMARLHVDMARIHEEIDIEGIQAEAMRSMELALAGLEEGEFSGEIVIDLDGARNWDDLSEEERAEIREELEEAREEIRESMREMRREMRRVDEEMTEAEREMRDSERERRHAMREARHAERAVRHAERDVRRAVRRAERDARHAERGARHAEREARVMRWHSEDGMDEDVDVRVFEGEDGERRVIINGEEIDMDGDNVFMFDGDHDGEHHARVMRWHNAGEIGENAEIEVIEGEDGERRVIINGEEVDMDDENVFMFRGQGDSEQHARVMRWRNAGEMDENVEVRVFEDEDGNRHVIINGEEVDMDGENVFVLDGMHDGDHEVHIRRMHGETYRGHDAEHGSERHAGMRREQVRVEQDDDGRRRVWVNDEEQTGDDLIDWLNRIESDRLAGGHETSEGGRRVVRIERRDGENGEVEIETHRVMVVREHVEHDED